jgi:hypothetical protein
MGKWKERTTCSLILIFASRLALDLAIYIMLQILNLEPNMHVNTVETIFHPLFCNNKSPRNYLMCPDQCYGSVKYLLNTDPDPAFQKIMDPESDHEKRNLQQKNRL